MCSVGVRRSGYSLLGVEKMSQQDWIPRLDIATQKNAKDEPQPRLADRLRLVPSLAERLRLLHVMAQAIPTSALPEEIAQTALSHLHRLIPYCRASITVFDGDAQLMRVLAVQTSVPSKIPSGTQMPLMEMSSAPDQVTTTLVYLEELCTDQTSPILRQLYEEGVRSCINVPLLTQGQLLGCLNIGADVSHFFAPEYIEIAQEAADLMAIALQQAQLRQTLQHKAEALEQANALLCQENAERGRVAEKALCESEERYRLLCDNASDMMVELDAQGQFLYASPNHLKTLGYPPAEMLGCHYLDLVHPDDVPLVQSHVESPKAGRFLFRIVHKQNGWHWLDAASRAFVTAKGEHHSVIIGRDISHQKQIQEALQKSEEQYRELFENSPDALVLLDFEGRITAANRRCETLFGYTKEECIGKDHRSFAPATTIQKAQERVRQVLNGEVDKHPIFEGKMFHKDGRILPIEFWIHPIFDQQRRIVGWQGSHRDITERKQAEADLHNLSHQLLEAQETERRFIAQELHDEIGQALSVVKLNLDVLEEQLDPVPARITDSIQCISQTLEQVRSLSLDLRPSLLDDMGIGAALEWYAQRQAERAGFILHIPDLYAERLDPAIEIACFRIAQEALTNITKYAQARDVWLTLQRERDTIQLCIRDNGRGFDLEAAQERARTGNSLGLISMQERVRRLGGEMRLQSVLQHGTEIRASFSVM